MIENIIEVKNLSKIFMLNKTKIYAVKKISFAVKRGECLALVGESGCGKSTTARLIMGLLSPFSGEICFKGENIAEITSSRKKLCRHIQIVFQDPVGSLNPRMKIKQSLMEPLVTHGYPKDKIAARVNELLTLVGLNPTDGDKYPHEFSGGQLQRVGIARAIALNPEVVILDEPTSSLDVSVQSIILKLLKRLQNDFKLTYIFITHDLGLVDCFADHVIVMYLGTIVETGPVKKVFEKPTHPYTRLLLELNPSIENTKLIKDISAYPKVLTSKIKQSTGCDFEERCPNAIQKCKNEKPALVPVELDHLASCFRVN